MCRWLVSVSASMPGIRGDIRVISTFISNGRIHVSVRVLKCGGVRKCVWGCVCVWAACVCMSLCVWDIKIPMYR